MLAVRALLVLLGGGAIAWALHVIPVFWSEMTPVAVANAVRNGEPFKPDILAAIDALTTMDDRPMLRSAVLGRVAMIRLRRAEESLRLNDPTQSDALLASLQTLLQQVLHHTPSDPFLWLALYWVDATRHGVRAESLSHLAKSYELGPNEGWIVLKRNPMALAIYPVLPPALAQKAVSEFCLLVRQGHADEAAEIVKGPGRSIRAVLYAGLHAVGPIARRNFARALDQRNLTDVPVPGVELPTQRPWQRSMRNQSSF